MNRLNDAPLTGHPSVHRMPDQFGPHGDPQIVPLQALGDPQTAALNRPIGRPVQLARPEPPRLNRRQRRTLAAMLRRQRRRWR